MDTKLLGQRLLLLRRDLKLQQEEVARRAGVTRPYISKIERGTAPGVTLNVVFRLAEALEVSPQYLMGLGEGSSPGIAPEDEYVSTGEALSEEERALLGRLVRLFQKLSPADQEFVLDMAERLERSHAPRIVGDS